MVMVVSPLWTSQGAGTQADDSFMKPMGVKVSRFGTREGKFLAVADGSQVGVPIRIRPTSSDTAADLG
jgi:hypothetical protein